MTDPVTDSASMDGAPIDGAPAPLEHYDRTRLEKLRLATEAILELADQDALPVPFESELYIFRDRVHLALLHPETAADLLPRREHEFSGPEHGPDAG